MDAVVLDEDGRPVRGLARTDFTLVEDGRPQTIVGFEPRELAPVPETEPPSEEGRIATTEREAGPPGRRSRS